jgi:predicted kinase
MEVGMKIAYIMRGVPGSGKSTVARQIAGNTGVIHSTDDYFVTNGEYCFDSSKIHEHREATYRAFCESLKDGVEVVICDNTNIHPQHFRCYAKSAEKAGYLVAYVVMPHPDPEIAARRNVHKVSEHAIRRMIQSWKD